MTASKVPKRWRINRLTNGINSTSDFPYVPPELVEQLDKHFPFSPARFPRDHYEYSKMVLAELTGEQRLINFLKARVREQEEDSRKHVSTKT